MKLNARLIILHSTKSGENSLILHCLTPEWGRRSFICRVSRSTSMALYLPLSINDALVTENRKSELWRVSGMSAAASLNGIRTNPYKNAISLFMSEVLYRAIHEGAYEPGLFEWCQSGIVALEELPSDCSNYHLVWLLGLCAQLGFAPSAEALRQSGLIPGKTLLQLLGLPPARALLLPMNGSERSESASILLKYLSIHIESNLNVRSLNVLQELFDNDRKQ